MNTTTTNNNNRRSFHILNYDSSAKKPFLVRHVEQFHKPESHVATETWRDCVCLSPSSLTLAVYVFLYLPCFLFFYLEGQLVVSFWPVLGQSTNVVLVSTYLSVRGAWFRPFT
jgi:hypothetical protein